jgi:hypothetical protein
MNKQAKIIEKQGAQSPNGREMRMELRSGAKGTGKLIQSVTYWPWSPKSVDAASEIMRQSAERAGVTVTPYEPED